ncbi:MAG: transcriptional repressor [Deltaproteobacteria bacterium]|nr:transcriptional repressor [Deltaproteobacteria bacterium]
MATPKADLKSRLRDAGLRATASRLAVLDCMIAAQGPLTHADVCERLDDAGFDRATVYRNLADLTDVGLLRRSDLGDHLWRFELKTEGAHEDHGPGEVHPHFVCTECGAVACLPDGAVTIAAVKGAPRAFRAGKVDIQVRGACNECV